MATLAYYCSPMQAERALASTWFGYRELRRTGRELRAILAKSRAWVLSLWSLPEPATPPPAAVVEHRPVDLPHWSPNMPRGAEPT